jgi:hypothetical protein
MTTTSDTWKLPSTASRRDKNVSVTVREAPHFRDFDMVHSHPQPVLPTHNAIGLGVNTGVALQNLTGSANSSGTTNTSPEQPWKTQGYQEFSKWMASENDFFVFRRFETLNANTILWMQYQISELERRLEEIHIIIQKSPAEDKLKNSSFKWDDKFNPERRDIMCQLSSLLLQYSTWNMQSLIWLTKSYVDQFIDAFSRVRARPRAESRQIDNVVNRLGRGAITADEATFIQKRGDLISIHSRSRPPLGRWLEACKSLHLWKLFRAKLVPDVHVTTKTTVYSSDEKFESFTTSSIITIGLVMLLAPMWWLEFTSTSTVRLGIITGFICAFISIMSMATTNRPFEVVAATAAYAAVLMVFMQIDGKGGIGN